MKNSLKSKFESKEVLASKKLNNLKGGSGSDTETEKTVVENERTGLLFLKGK